MYSLGVKPHHDLRLISTCTCLLRYTANSDTQSLGVVSSLGRILRLSLITSYRYDVKHGLCPKTTYFAFYSSLPLSLHVHLLFAGCSLVSCMATVDLSLQNLLILHWMNLL